MASLSQQRFTDFLWLLLVCCFLIAQVDGIRPWYGEVRLEVLLTGFSNPRNINALNRCCDGNKNASICTDSCDIFFVVCPQHRPPASCEKSQVISRNSSEFIASQRNFTSSSGNQVGNFVSMFFKVNPKQFTQFSIHLYDDDSSSGSPNLGNYSSYEAVINYTETLPTPVKYVSIYRNISKDNISFEFLYRLHLTCQKDFYGEMCDKYCKPRNDGFGHTKCLSNGTKVCLPGWKGRECKIAICPDGCVNGSCDKPNHCKCLTGWKGTSCSECVPRSRCLHATCTDPAANCICKTSWTGVYCNVHLDYCSHYHPCKNGRCFNNNLKNFTCQCSSGWDGPKCDRYLDYCSHYHPCQNGRCFNNNLKNFTCQCSSGWDGPKCDRFLCSSSCNLTNAVCTKNGKCSCNRGWTGANCNQCIPTRNCTHGYCKRPFECLCEDGWGGENCTEPASKSRCSQQNPCQNDGECLDVAMGDYRCKCKRGFTGRHCHENVLDPCLKWCNESHGYCQDSDCKCHRGWQGRNCTECIKNASCVNGYCRRPFECICHKYWTGPSCNISLNDTNECTPGSNRSRCGKTGRIGSDKAISDTDRLIYILSSVLVLLIIVCLIVLAWWRYRRRATFHISSPEIVANNLGRPSYITGNNSEKHELTLNNNVSAKPDYDNYTSSEILLNPMALQPSQTSRSMLINNGPEIYESNGIISTEDNQPDSSEYCIIANIH